MVDQDEEDDEEMEELIRAVTGVEGIDDDDEGADNEGGEPRVSEVDQKVMLCVLVVSIPTAVASPFPLANLCRRKLVLTPMYVNVSISVACFRAADLRSSDQDHHR